jgi:RimJ/RimL family protein N-acetyltransferase
MDRDLRWNVTWTTSVGCLRAYQPSAKELAAAAPVLAGFYNDAYNRTMMDNTVAMTADEVIEHFESLRATGGMPFLLERDGDLTGDADLRHLADSAAEFAILIGRRPEQGTGLGTRFAILLHAFAFVRLDLDHVFVSIIPANIPSQRLFAKLGYLPDERPEARAFADHDDDLTLSLDRNAFVAAQADVLPEITWTFRQSKA